MTISTALGLPESYVFLLKQALVNDLYIENEAQIVYLLYALVEGKQIDLKELEQITQQPAMDIVDRAKEEGATIVISKTDQAGQTHPLYYLRSLTDVSHTMIGRKRLNNLEHCLAHIVADAVPGDLIETGVWRGGASIFMRGFLRAHGIEDRLVWVADSFAGLPAPSRPEDAGYDLSSAAWPGLAVSLEAVQALFRRYGLLDDHVRFLKGWFKDTLPTAPIDRLALLRLDGDLYESTIDALEALYAKVSSGGYVIVDDYFSMPPCAQAVDDFRRRHGIGDALITIDRQGVYWRKSA
jgi:O-methyltransferase